MYRCTLIQFGPRPFVDDNMCLIELKMWSVSSIGLGGICDTGMFNFHRVNGINK